MLPACQYLTPGPVQALAESFPRPDGQVVSRVEAEHMPGIERRRSFIEVGPAVKWNLIGTGIRVAGRLISGDRIEVFGERIGSIDLQALGVSAHHAHLQRVVPGIVSGVPQPDR